MRRILALTLTTVAAVCAVVYATGSYAATYAPSDASVTTDKTDYQPGETVVISGSGFAAGESVAITLKEDPAKHPDTQLSATADEYGNFVNKDFSPNDEHVGTTFALKAVGQTSGRSAETQFGDGPTWSYSSVPNPATFAVTADGSPHSVNATINVIAPDTGGGKPSASNVITVSPQISPGANPIPNSWLSPLPNLTFNTSPQTLPWNVTVTVPPYTAAGSYSTMIKANPPPGKGGAGPGINITVNVTADNAAPNTALSAANADTTNYNGADWTNQSVTVTLSATDTGTPTTGVASTRYNLDGLGYLTYAAPFTVSAQGLHTLLYQSQDFQGNVETPAKSFTIKIDKTKPVIMLDGAADITVVIGSGPFSDPGATATDSGGSGLNGAVTSTGVVDTNIVGDYTLDYDVSDKAGNAADTVSRTVHVVKAEQTIDFGPLADKTYGDPDFDLIATSGSGDAVTFTSSGDCTVSGATVHIDGAGSCTITAHQPGNASYNAAPDVSQSFNIAKANATIIVTGYSVIYDGAPHTAGGSASGVLGEDLSGLLDLSGTTHTNAGSYNGDAWSFAGDANYNSAAGTVDDAIAKAPSSVAINCAPGQVYTGAAVEPCTANATGAGGLDESLAVVYSDNVNAGTANASASFGGDDNHDGSSNSTTFEIAKAPSTTVVTFEPGPYVYRGSAFNASAVATGVGGLNSPVSVAYSGDCTNVTTTDGCTATAAYAGDGNHDGSSDSKSITITKAATITTVTCGAGPFTYNGSAQTPCSAAVTGPGGLNQSLAVSYLNNTNAGTATASASYAGSSNYLSSGDSENFTIGKANATVNVTGYTGFYDGSAHGATGTATGVLGEDLSGLLNLGSSFTNVPGGTANWTFNASNTNTNYNSQSGSVQIVIKAWTTLGFYQPVDMSPVGGPVVLNTIKGGSTVPLKFEIFSGATEKTSVADILSFQFQEFACGSASTFESPIEVTTTGGTSLRYDATAGQFIQNWQTPKTAGRCYQVRMTAKDGSKIDAFFKTK